MYIPKYLRRWPIDVKKLSSFISIDVNISLLKEMKFNDVDIYGANYNYKGMLSKGQRSFSRVLKELVSILFCHELEFLTKH